MTIFSRVYSYVTRMLIVCTRMLLVCLLVCTRVLLVCYSYALVCTRMSLVCTRMLLVCYSCVVFSHDRSGNFETSWHVLYYFIADFYRQTLNCQQKNEKER